MCKSCTLFLLLFCFFLLSRPHFAGADLPLDYAKLSQKDQVEALILDLAQDPNLNRAFIDQELQGLGESAIPHLLFLLDKYDKARKGNEVSAIVTLLDEYPIDTFRARLHGLLQRYGTDDSPALWSVAAILKNHPHESSIDPLTKQIELLDVSKAPEGRSQEYMEKKDALFDALFRTYDHQHSDKAFKVILRLYNQYGGGLENDFKRIISDADKTKVPLLIEYVKERSYRPNKGLALQRVVAVGDRKVVLPLLFDLLRTGDENVRHNAIDMLEEKADQSAAPFLLKAMEKENDKLIRVKIASVLVKVGRFSCAEYLVHLIESPYKDSQSWGRDQLVIISGNDLGFNHAAWSRWFEEEKKRREPEAREGCVRNSWIDQ